VTDYTDELRAARVRLLTAEAEAKECEVAFGKLKIEEATRALELEKAQGAENRILTFATEVATDTVTNAIRTLDVWSRATPGCDLQINLTTLGGDIYSCFRFVDYIEELKKRNHKVIVKVMGNALSAGSAILQAATERVMTPNSWLLIHEAQIGELSGNFTQVSEASKQIKRHQEQLIKLLASRSTLSAKQIRSKWTNADWYLDAEEALSYGLIDRIEA